MTFQSLRESGDQMNVGFEGRDLVRFNPDKVPAWVWGFITELKQGLPDRVTCPTGGQNMFRIITALLNYLLRSCGSYVWNRCRRRHVCFAPRRPPTPVIFNKFYKMDFQWTIASRPLGGTHANELIRMREARAGPCNFTTFKHPLWFLTNSPVALNVVNLASLGLEISNNMQMRNRLWDTGYLGEEI